MKSIIFLASIFLSLISFADGGSISSGPVGQEFLNCTGNIQGSTTTIRGMVIQGQGLVLKAFIGSAKPVVNNVVKNSADARGLIYVGNPYSVLIPNIQNNNEPNTYQAHLYSGQQMVSFLKCSN